MFNFFSKLFTSLLLIVGIHKNAPIVQRVPQANPVVIQKQTTATTSVATPVISSTTPTNVNLKTNTLVQIPQTVSVPITQTKPTTITPPSSNIPTSGTYVDSNGNMYVNGILIPATKYDSNGIPVDPNNASSLDNQTDAQKEAEKQATIKADTNPDVSITPNIGFIKAGGANTYYAQASFVFTNNTDTTITIQGIKLIAQSSNANNIGFSDPTTIQVGTAPVIPMNGLNGYYTNTFHFSTPLVLTPNSAQNLPIYISKLSMANGGTPITFTITGLLTDGSIVPNTPIPMTITFQG